jgi:CubicO group peptidase (beta-lactamase class C family)
MMKVLPRKKIQLAFAAWLIVMIAGPAAAQFKEVRAKIKRELVEQDVPSLAVAVARNGKIIWEEGFGWADREKRISATEHTMYSLASISKPITATGLMVLVERGLVDLDKPINDYLGEAKLNGRAFDASGATVRLVANHTAGLPLHYQFFYRDEPYRRPAMDETIRRYANLVTPPGERSQYSNLGYGIIDFVLERVSGKSYPVFMREEVFLPLGLTRMSVHIGPGLEEFTATRYNPEGEPYPFYDFDHPGGSAVFSSAHDLVRFGMFHLKNHLADQRQIISDESIDEMHVPTASEEEGSGYGIGWSSHTNDKGLRTVSHSGGMGGVRTNLILLPDQNAAVVVLCNGSSSLPSEISQEIIALLAPGKTEESESQEVGAEVELPKELIEKFVGNYALGSLTARIYEDNGGLAVETNRGSSPLIYQGDGVFIVSLAPSIKLKFEVEEGDTFLTFEAGDTVLRGSRQPEGPWLTAMPELVGTWRGEVATYQGDLPITIVVKEAGGVYIQLGDQPWTVLDQAAFSEGVLGGIFSGDIGTEDANRRPYNLRLEVKKRDNVLNGSLIALSLPGKWVGNALTHWIEVKRK